MIIATGLVDYIGCDQDAFEKTSVNGTIVVGFNEKDRALKAVASALSLAKELGFRVWLQSILDQEASQQDSEASIEKMKSVVGSLPVAGDLIAISTRKMPTHFEDEEYGRARLLMEAATTLEASFIVVGVHEGGKPLSGTMTEQLLRESPCPVLISTTEHEKKYSRALLAVDFSEHFQEALDLADRLAPSAQIHLVHAHQSSGIIPKQSESDIKSAEQRLQDIIRDRATSYNVHVTAGAPDNVLRQKTDEIKPDLFIIGTRGRTGLTRFLLGSVATSFIDTPPCDLIAIRAR